jgi:hypothetical protein
MDRLLRCLHKSHSAFDLFAHYFSEAIFIRDIDDEEKVQAMLQKKGLDWHYYKRAKSKLINQRIRRYIPDPKTLHSRLSTLFNCFKNIRCSTSKRSGHNIRFFSDEALEMAERLLETVRLGFLSDPPGLPLYYIKGKDRDGLTVYRTIRGTNSVEGGIHMAIQRVFGSLRASPQMSDALIMNWMHRRNIRVRNMTYTHQEKLMFLHLGWLQESHW